MSKTLLDLQTGVRTYLQESAQADWLDSEVTTAINYAYQDLVSRVIEVYEQYYETTTPFTYAIVANQQEYTIDPSLIKVTRVECNYRPDLPSSSSTPLRVIPIKSDEVLVQINYNPSLVSFFNAGYYLHGPLSAQKIGLIPIPSVSDTTDQSLKVWGDTLQSNLVNATDTPNIPFADNYSQLIEFKAASRLMSKGQQDETSSSKYNQLYEIGVDQMQIFLKDRQADSVKTIEDSQGDNLDLGWGY